MSISQRQVTIGSLVLLAIGSLLGLVFDLTSGSSTLQIGITAVAVLLSIGLLYVYWRGWDYARYVTILVITMISLLITQEPYLTQRVSLAIFIAPVLALVLGGPLWVLICAFVTLGGLLIQAGGQGVYADPQTIVIYSMIIGGMILARLVTDTAHRNAEENAKRLADALNHVEQQARDLSEANELMTVQLDQQNKLLELVTTLETPVVPLAEGMLLAPIVGHVDTRRAQAFTARLLSEVSTQRARLVVLDIGGVAVMDTAVAKSLLHTVQALRLLGSEVILSGISANVAMALIHLGINLDEVKTVRSPQEALAQYLSDEKQPDKLARFTGNRSGSSGAPPKLNGSLSRN
jgi:rsbT co-antagonist protein RsbR